MKAKLLLLLILANFSIYAQQYTAIPDINFEKKLIALGYDTAPEDGQVLTANITSLTSLNVSKSAISDLTGIQDFTSLTQLNVSENLLTNLDFSNNIKLKGLQVSKNQLTALNVSKNTALTDLSCYANKLTALNISALTSLTNLTCSSNILTSLDVDNNESLNYLNCGNNQLTAINVSKNTALITFYCHANKITSLDVSNNILLEYFMCHDNQLKAINVSKNAALIMFDCLDNQLTSVDISNNPKITELACENNKLVSLNLKNGANTNLDLAFTNFKNNPDLKCIQVDDVNYSNANWSAIKDASAEFNTDCPAFTLIPDANFEDKLIALNIDKDGKNGKVITKDIASITTLDLSNSSISDLTGIQDFAALQSLNCSTNVLTALDLAANKKLTVLNCSENQLTTLHPGTLPLLTSLNCSYNSITSLDITKNPSLVTINFSNNALNSLNLKNGFNTNLDWFNVNFTKNPALSCIQVDNAQYSNDNWNGKLDKTSYFTEDCSSFTLIPDSNFEDKLIELKIDIDGKNGKVLTSSISKVTDLNVQLSEISDLTGIEGFTALEYLNCQFNNLSSLNLSQNSKLIELSCHGNKLTTLDLATNTELTTLQANKNQIAKLDLSQNAKLVYVNVMENALTSLNLKNGNNTNFQGALLTKNPTLSCIQVDDTAFATTRTDIFYKDSAANYNVVCVNYTLIPDVNFENKLISLGIDSGSPDGKVQTSKISTLVSLDIANSNITDLTGIQDFTELKYFFCNSNSITTIDLSKNLLLENLDVKENNLTSLNVSKNIKLQILEFAQNQISSIDLSENTNLSQIGFNFNKLTEINLTNNNLTELHCRGNSLTNLNLTAQTNLKLLECGNNKIVSLNLTSNKKLEELECANMGLTSLNVSENKELVLLNAFGNELTSLDFSQNPKLKGLYVEFNPLKTLNLKNGNNENFILANPTNKSQTIVYTSFLNNPNLSCIQVDNVEYSNSKWSKIKDETANYNVECIQYTLIPDVNFENKLISLGIDSGTPDGKVQTSKISSITDLDLYNASITNLTGIQDFVSLTNLSVMSNQLTTLDISQNLTLTNLNAGYNKLKSLDTSNNIALEYLSFYYNEITNLDLSTNINLSLLACGNNQLTAIDLSNNKKLSTLWCPSNQLTNLDVSKTSVMSLLCSENKLLTSVNLRNGKNTSIQSSINGIDFTKNPLLSCILVDNALYSNENWTDFKEATASYSTVDCSQITAIPDPAFEDKLIALNIDTDGKNGSVLNNSISTITSLDVASAAIKDLTGIKGFTSLSTLDCSGNMLSVLDLSQSPALTVVNCSSNTLVSLNLKNGNNNNFALTSNFTNNTNLTCIQVDDADYSTANWTTLKDANANYNVDCNKYTLIPDANFEDKLIALEIDKDGKNGKVETASINKITFLDLSSSNISDLTGIEDFTALTYLDCNYNNISNIDISHNKLLKKFAIYANKLTSLDLKANTELFNLAISINQISTIDLSQNKKLHYVTADRNLLTNLNVDENKELESIYCGENKLTSINLRNLPNLTSLNCGENNITSLDLTSNTQLVDLYCSNMKLTALDLNKNVLLKRLQASWNQLTTLDLSQNPNLELVFLEFNPLTSLNVQNGNNKNFVIPSPNGKKSETAIYTSFLGNKTLSCIKVDDAAFSNANWSKIKETNTTYSETCTLGLEESVFDKVIVYPNPTKGEVSINNIALEKVTVYNTIGQLVKTFTLDSASTNSTIDLSGLPKGVYYIYLINEDAASAKKIIVE
jgi:Leucine-rich repeat (LRR) protein